MGELIDKLRNAFIVSDDTSTCESLCRDCSEFLAEINREYGISQRYSPEVTFTPDSNLYHWKCLFEQRVRKTSKLHTSRVSYQPEDVAECISGLLNAEPLPPRAPFDPSKKSALTIALEKVKLNGKSVNKFNDFAIFDGRSADGKGVFTPKTQSAPRLHPFVVWFWHIPGLPRISLSINPTSSCTVRDLVGLSLWQYFNENPSAIAEFNSESHHLQKDALSIIKHIDVYMYDTQDDVDEFPPIQPSDYIYKYDFDALALVENTAIASAEEVNTEPLIYVTVHLAQGISLVRFPPSATLGRVLNEAINRRKLRQHEGYAYRLEEWVDLEKKTQPFEIRDLGQETARRSLDLSMTLAEYTKNNPRPHFVLIREHSRYDPVVGDDDRGSYVSVLADCSAVAAPSSPSNDAVTRSLQSRKYRASLLRDANPRDVLITVSRDRLEVQTSRLPKFFRGASKSFTVPMSHVVDCSLCTASTQTGELPKELLSKVKFIISYLPQTNVFASVEAGSSKEENQDESDLFNKADIVSLVFEAQWTSARAICHQINLIFSCCSSHIRDFYFNLRQSK